MSITGTCHCGDISITAPRLPDLINDCQCGVCRRYGAAWGYYPIDDVQVTKKPGASTKIYLWGDLDCEFHFCARCGGVVFWWPTDKKLKRDRGMGLNTNMVDPDLLLRVERRKQFDVGWGKGSWAKGGE